MLVVVAGHGVQNRRVGVWGRFWKGCGKVEGGWRWPAFHRPAPGRLGEEGVQGEERVSFPQAAYLGPPEQLRGLPGWWLFANGVSGHAAACLPSSSLSR
jgi:hypothetical protein